MREFVTSGLKLYINTFIKKTILINLNIEEFDQLMIILENLINYIALKFNFDSDPSLYEAQLKHNNNSDICSLLNLLLPFIDDDNNKYTLHKQIVKLSDISIKKKESKQFIEKDNTNNYNFNPYIISNIQYNRHIPNPTHLNEYNIKYYGNYFSYKELYAAQHEYKNNYFFEYQLSISDILNNFYLLIDTITQISNKLYVNWINIRPISDYKNSILYKNTYKYNHLTDKYEIGDKIDFTHNILIPLNVSFPDNILEKSDYKGLDIGDVYNMIHHELYFNIKEIKWVIYDLPFNVPEYNGLYNYWNLLCNIFPNLNNYIINNINFDLVDNVDKINWLNIKNELYNKIHNDAVICRLIYNILYYLQRKYSNQHDLNLSNYIVLNITFKNKIKTEIDLDKILDVLEEESARYEFSIEDIINSWKSLQLNHFYEYIRETIISFRKTWYGYKIIDKKQYIPFPNDQPINVSNNISNYIVTYKNIYNYAKSILFYVYSIGNYDNQLPENLFYYKNYTWSTLSMTRLNKLNNSEQAILEEYIYNNKNRFITAFNNPYNDNVYTIFNIIKNYYYKHITLSFKEIESLNDNIYKQIKINIIDICFECLHIRGLLSEFIPNINYSNNAINLTTIHDIFESIFNDTNINKYNECYYYLTGEQYKKLPLVDNLTYFKFLQKKTSWYTLHAMQWLSQILFFHKYINNRIIYITGGTAQGKSTQIPKLFMYALKMINHNNKGKIVSTQPRITPTISNAKIIAKEIGTPITTFFAEYNKEIKTFLGYVQYKTLKDYHLDNTTNSYLKEMTDGTLVLELIKNPLLKILTQKNKDDLYDNKLSFGLDNLYDIIIIDEAHEHNKNMDIILTLMKYAVYWNNSLKLVIVSATMFNDEPIYRRYYKEINDNMMYPINYYNSSVQYTYNNCIYTLDRCTVDRRIHISPPGLTTVYSITDTYLPYDTNTYTEAENLGIQHVLDIINKTTYGDILFFTIGYKEIVNLVTELNKLIPSNVITLPFYGELKEEWKEIAEKSHMVKNLTINKHEIFKEIKNKNTASKVSYGTYNRAIIVATNVAEASITIVNLRYVIDTGYYNLVKYDVIQKKTIIEIAKISESSRIQRRGRIGRVAEGIVYYMYKYESRLNIKQEYNLCNDNILYDLFKLLRKNCNEKLLISNEYDIYNIMHDFDLPYENKLENKYTHLNININTRIIIDYKNTFKKLKSSKYIKDNKIKEYHNIETWLAIHNMIEYQYLYHHLNSKRKMNFIYLGDKNLNSYYIAKKLILNINDILYLPCIRYLTGYNISTLCDYYGLFYILHPCEELIIRHFLTGLIDLHPDRTDVNFFKKIYNYIFTMYYSNMIKTDDKFSFDLSLSFLNYDFFNYNKHYEHNLYGLLPELCVEDDEDNNTNDFFYKTKFANMLLTITEKIELDKDSKNEDLKLRFMIIIIYSNLLNIQQDIIQIISALLVLGVEPITLLPTEIIDEKSKIILNKNPLSFFKDNGGDILLYYNIFKKFQPVITLSKKEIKNTDIDYDIVAKKYIEYKNQIILNYSIKKENNLHNIKFTDSFNIKDFELMQKIDQKNNLNDILGKKEYNITKTNNIIENELSFDLDIIKKIASEYYLDSSKIILMIKKYISISHMLNIEKKYFEWFNENLKITKEPILKDNIIKVFLYGFIENLSLSVNKYVINIFNGNVFLIKDKIPNRLSSTTILPNKIIFYIKIDNYGNVININNINLDWAIEYMPLIINIHLIKNTLQYTNIAITSKFNKI